MRARWLLALAVPSALLFAACGSPSAPPSDARAEAPVTAGGEASTEASEPERPARVLVALGTVPVPVPQPAVPREELSTSLQRAWSSVEDQVALTRPEGPPEATVETVQAWANGPFQEWIQRRRAAIEATHALLAEVPREPAHERALAVALFAYSYEDLGAQIAGAPVPAEIAEDEELRGIYAVSLNQASVPLGQRAMELYAECRERLAALGDESPWLPWRAYCVQRGQEVIRGYGLVPADELPPEPEPPAEE